MEDMTIDSEAVKDVVEKVAAKLARTYRKSFNGSREDLVQEAWMLCLDTDVLSGASSIGAFAHRLRARLIDSQKTERSRRDLRHSGDISEIEDDLTQTSPELAYDGRQLHRVGERSRLLDHFASMSKAEFSEWAETELGKAWAKKRDLHALLYGYEDEVAEVWAKHVSGKRAGAPYVAFWCEGEGIAPVTAADRAQAVRDAWSDGFTRNPDHQEIDPRGAGLWDQRPLRAFPRGCGFPDQPARSRTA